MYGALILSKQLDKINLLSRISFLDRVYIALNSSVHIVVIKCISLIVFHRLNLRLEVSSWAKEVFTRWDIKRLSELWITHLFDSQSSQPLDDVLLSCFRVDTIGLITALGERHQVIGYGYSDLFSSKPSVIFLYKLLLLFWIWLKALYCKLVQIYFPFFFLCLFRLFCLLIFSFKSELMQEPARVRK